MNTNIFIMENFTEYEYRIYSFLANWSNTNIEYLIFGAKYSNIRIYSFYTVKFGKSQHANLKNEDNFKDE